MRVRWLGHATVELESGTGRLLTDPVLRARIAHLRRRVPPAALPERLDAILISHGHQDHLDLPSLRLLDPDAVLVVPAGLGGAARRAGREVVELAVGESTQAGGMHVTAVPAVHTVRRVPLGPETSAVGFVVAAGAQRVYFAGDTAIFDGLAELGPIDLALLPVWGWGFSLGPGHMDPAEAARARSRRSRMRSAGRGAGSPRCWAASRTCGPWSSAAGARTASTTSAPRRRAAGSSGWTPIRRAP